MSANAEGRRLADVRRAQALQLRAAGASYRDIAAAMGCSVAVAHKLTTQALETWAREPLDAVLAMENERLDQLLRAFWPAATAGDVEAAALVLRILERRARMLGLDAPKRIDVSAIVARWAADEGLDPGDVLAVTVPLLQELERG